MPHLTVLTRVFGAGKPYKTAPPFKRMHTRAFPIESNYAVHVLLL